MLWIKIGWRNLWRSKARTLLQTAAIAGGIFLTVFFRNLTAGSYAQMIREGTKIGSGHVGFYLDHYLEDRKAEQFFLSTKIIPELRKNQLIDHFFERLTIPGLIQSSRESCGAAIYGMDILAEKDTNPIFQPKNFATGTLSINENRDKAMIGFVMAKSLQVTVGNKIVLSFQDQSGKIVSQLFRISGILKTGIGQIDRSVVFVDRRQLATLFGNPDAVHEIAVLLKDYAFIPAFLQQVDFLAGTSKNVKAYPWEIAMPELSGAISIDRFQLKILFSILFFLIAIGAVNTLLMSVVERTREFGLLRALGLHPSAIRKVILAEGLVLSLLGILIGQVFAFCASLYTHIHGIDLTLLVGKLEVAGMVMDSVIYSGWDIPANLLASFLMIAIVLTSSLYPAHRALKIRPSDAMRKY
ncbi:MAG: ABC transporter permease [Candidatus Riflebacteria bacterium]|nr:ABC transporter permease [Candidatus Riflebacteria bacterium]